MLRLRLLTQYVFSFLFFYLFLSPARATITLDKLPCGRHNVEAWINDALWLSTRAAANLNDALNVANGNIAMLPPQVLRILRAFLGPSAGMNDFNTVASKSSPVNLTGPMLGHTDYEIANKLFVDRYSRPAG